MAASVPLSAPAPLAIHARNVTKQFGGLMAVDDFNFRLPDGALYGLIGPNGAGKTTAFNLITGVYPVTKGEIQVMGRSITGLRVDQIARLGMSRTFQNSRLFRELTVLDNIRVAFHRSASYGPLSTLLFGQRFVEAEGRIFRESMELLQILELDGVAFQTAGSLPYGAQRRLEIARALATGARILLLDEPAAGMNHQEKDELAAWILRLREQFKLTLLLIEHDMKFVMGLCEHIYVLDHGVLIAEGNPAEIQANPKVIEAYLGTGTL